MSEEERTQVEYKNNDCAQIIYTGDTLTGETIAHVEKREHRERIVTAVNNHEALVKAARNLAEFTFGDLERAEAAEAVLQLLTQIETNTNKQKDVNDDH